MIHNLTFMIREAFWNCSHICICIIADYSDDECACSSETCMRWIKVS